MRLAIPALLLVATGCNVANDPANDRVTVNYDEGRIRKAAHDTGAAAKAVGKGLAHVGADTARSIKREVGDVDVDVKVSRIPKPEPSRPLPPQSK